MLEAFRRKRRKIGMLTPLRIAHSTCGSVSSSRQITKQNFSNLADIKNSFSTEVENPKDPVRVAALAPQNKYIFRLSRI